MKQYLKKTFWRLSDAYLKALGPARFPQAARSTAARHVVVLTPSGVGNLGDEAMVTSVVTQLRAHQPDIRITLITHDPGDDPHYDHFNVETLNLNGYFAKTPDLSVCSKLGALFGEATDFILLGADIIDGRYSESRSFRRLFLARMAERAGLSVFVLGFSYSDKAVPLIRRYMRAECATFHYMCRDPLSAGRVAEVIGRPVENGADLAFLLPVPEVAQAEAAKRAEAQIAAWRDEGRQIVVLNANPLGLLNAFPDIDLSETAAAYARGINLLGRQTGCVFLFLTHDNRPAHSDAAFMEKILAGLDPELTWHFVPETVRAVDIKRLCSQVDLTVTGRMHLGIASLGAGTATMILDFQGKVRGLFDLFGQPEMAFDVSEVMKEESFAGTIAAKLADHQALATHVKGQLDMIHELSGRNMALVWKAWEAGR